MKILISGSKLNSNTVGAFMQPYLSDHITKVLAFHDEFSQRMKLARWRLVYRLAPDFLVRQMDDLFVDQVRSIRPDVVIVFKGMEISVRALKEIKRLGVPLVNYNFDHPFHFFSRGSGNARVKQAIPYYDLHLSYSLEIVEELKAQFGVKSAWLPFAHHLDDQVYEEVLSRGKSEIREACFVGNPDPWRVKVIGDLVAAGLTVNLFGFGWSRHFAHTPRAVIHQPRKALSYWSEPSEFWQVLRQYRLQLNFFRPHNEGSHNLRTFEVPAVGGILLSPDSKEQRQFFEEEKEIFYWNSPRHLVEQSHKLLAMAETDVAVVRDRARLRSIISDYSYSARTRQMLQIIQKNLFQ